MEKAMAGCHCSFINIFNRRGWAKPFYFFITKTLHTQSNEVDKFICTAGQFNETLGGYKMEILICFVTGT